MTLHETVRILNEALNVAHAAMQAAFEREEVAYAVYNRAMHRADIHESPAQRRYDEAVDEAADAQVNFNAIRKQWDELMLNPEAALIVNAQLEGAF